MCFFCLTWHEKKKKLGPEQTGVLQRLVDPSMVQNRILCRCTGTELQQIGLVCVLFVPIILLLLLWHQCGCCGVCHSREMTTLLLTSPETCRKVVSLKRVMGQEP